VFWAFGVTDREELELTVMMTGYDMAFRGLVLIVLNECKRYAGLHHGPEYYYGMVFNRLTTSVAYLV
jgi:hypothetical protein